jgi:hypothetical protein
MSGAPFEMVDICNAMAVRNIVADGAFAATRAGMARDPDRTVGPRAPYRAGREPGWPFSRRPTDA